MASVAADRLYLGETIIWEKPQDANGQIVDFPEVPLLDWQVVNGLDTAGSVNMRFTQPALEVNGYAPIAYTDLGSPDGYLSTRVAQGNPTLIFRYKDTNNWMYWAASSGRFRVRENGVSHDYEAALPSGLGQLGVLLDGPDIWLIANARIIDLFSETRFLTETRHGVGSPADTSQYTRHELITWEPAIEGTFTASYIDTASALTAIDEATTVIELESALNSVASLLSCTVNIDTNGSFRTGPLDFSHPNLKIACIKTLEAFSAFPVSGFSSSWVLNICVDLTSGAAAISGLTQGANIWANIEPTETKLETVIDDVPNAFLSTIYHEVAHLISNINPGHKNVLESDFEKANPPGFSYGGDAVGGRPDGFCRGYGTTSVREDQADVFGWLMTPALRGEIDARTATDDVLAAKKLAMRKFLGRIGWGIRAIEVNR